MTDIKYNIKKYVKSTIGKNLKRDPFVKYFSNVREHSSNVREVDSPNVREVDSPNDATTSTNTTH